MTLSKPTIFATTNCSCFPEIIYVVQTTSTTYKDENMQSTVDVHISCHARIHSGAIEYGYVPRNLGICTILDSTVHSQNLETACQSQDCTTKPVFV